MSKQTIALIDYGMGNLHSAAKALEKAAQGQANVVVTADAQTILNADRVVFPGVGAMRDCMAEIKRLGIDQVVTEVAKTKPMLAICVGMQALMSFSEENDGIACIDMFKGQVKYFGDNLLDAHGEKLKVPHMGWNQVQQTMLSNGKVHPIFEGLAQDTRFYFVHSYYVAPEATDLVIGTCDYNTRFAAVLAHENIVASQFHPEKSQHAGLAFLKNFIEWDGAA